MADSPLYALFAEHATATPEHPAVTCAGHTITYRDLDRQSNAVAAALRNLDIARDNVIGLCLEPSPDYIAAMFGVLKSGAAFMPLAPDTPVQRLTQMLNTGQPVRILTHKPLEHLLNQRLSDAGHRIPVLSLDTLPPVATAPDAPTAPDDLGYLMFTSGSTGTPRAIAGRRGGLHHFIMWEINEFGLDSACRVSLLAAPTFDVSLRDILVPLLAGGTLCVPAPAVREQPRALIDWLAHARVTQVHCVPSLFRLLLAELESRDADPLPDLERILLAGEPLYARDVRRWCRAMGQRIELVNLYGPTETTLAKLFYRIAEIPDTENGIIPLGKPISDTDVLVIRNQQPCRVRQVGEIHIKTRYPSKGYYGDPELTAHKFVPNPLTGDDKDVVYRTGDLGRYRDDGTVEFIGRLDNQVKLNGIRIELGEVETTLLLHPQVHEAVSVVRRDGTDTARLVAYFTAAESLAPDTLREHLSAYLPANIQPGIFVQMETLPLNLHGKVDRKALPAPTDLLYESQDFVAPEGDTEIRLAEIWGALLGLASVAADRTFINLGGDSLKAIRAVGEIFKAFEVEVSLRSFFEEGTIRRLAQWLENQGGIR